jgi:hypothetical protein
MHRASSLLAKRFLVPPFSVLNAREGDWQERKRAWVAMGLRGEVGRNALCNGNKGSAHDVYRVKRNDGTGVALADVHNDPLSFNGSSIFDPVLCELVYRWFARADAQVLDPFAGGSVRGVVAAEMGLRYWGCDLRQEQIDANRAQADQICEGEHPEWVVGDSTIALANAPLSDLLFSCPPYGDLEEYSTDARDLSHMEWPKFVDAYQTVIAASVGRLREDRFACFVVGDFRDPKGLYRNFVGLTVNAFEKAGARFYNEAIYITPCGSLPLRVSKQFEAGRKLGKTHQNVLVFVKGDWKRAATWCARPALDAPTVGA